VQEIYLSTFGICLLSGGALNCTALTDVTSPGDPIFDWPRGSSQTTVNFPYRAIDNDPATKFFSYSGDTEPTGLDVTPSIGRTIVTGLRIATANDSPVRDPVKFELWGSNASIDGPYTLIATGDIVDFNQTATWPRNSWGQTPITFANNKGYDHYRLTLYPIRDASAADGNGLQIGEFELLGVLGSGTEASSPIPAEGATDVSRDVVISWTPGGFAATHDVYLGTVFADVNNASGAKQLGVLLSQNQDANVYDPGILEFGQTYYWRIDEVNAPPTASTIFRGEVWSFTVEPLAYEMPAGNITATASSFVPGNAPENTINGSGLVDDLHSADTATMWLSDGADPGPVWVRYDFGKVYKLHQMLIWNYNGSFILTRFGLKDVTIEYSEDDQTWTLLPDAKEFAQAPGAGGYAYNTTVDFHGAAAQSVRITANSNWGGPIYTQYGLSEVRFLHIPVHARYPHPDSGAKDIGVDATLAWRAGREAATHKVYLSTDQQAVIDGTAAAVSMANASYSATLDLSSTYYWRIDEVNDVETPTTWQGDVWSFSTSQYVIVDDFESYNDIDLPDPKSHTIFDAWIDGFLTPTTNGALVGYDLPQPSYAEKTIIHSGKQSMPLFYGNTSGATYSEASRTFAASQDWTRHGIATLVLYFYGTPGNTGRLYVKVNDAKVAYPGDAADIARPRWKQWNIDLASLGIALQNVTTLAVGIDGNGAAGTLYVDDVVLYRSAPAVASEEIWIEAEAGSITAPLKVFSAIPGASGGQYIEVESGNNSSSNPPTAGGVASYTITIQGEIYKINCRVIAPGGSNDSLWVRIQGATTQTVNHSSGWVRWNDIAAGSGWHWDVVHSSDGGNREVEWTMAAGTYTLTVAYREEGVLLDAIVIAKIR